MRKLWSASNVAVYSGRAREPEFLNELSPMIGEDDRSTTLTTPCRRRRRAYRGHVYRDCMVSDQPVVDHLVIVQPVVGRVVEDAHGPSYFGDLRTAPLGTEPSQTGE